MMERRGYELKTLFFGRPIRPFHLAVMIATVVIGYQLLVTSKHDNPEAFCACGTASHVLGSLSLIASLFLFLGWFVKPEWRRKNFSPLWFAEWGLLLAVGVWLTRAVYVLISDDESGLLRNPYASALLSIAWAIGAGGAYLLERYDEETRPRE